MAQQVKQYYISNLNDLGVFPIMESAICQLTIEAAPSSGFYINGHEIHIGVTGVYEIITEYITSLNITNQLVKRLTDNADSDGNLRDYDKILINIVNLDA